MAYSAIAHLIRLGHSVDPQDLVDPTYKGMAVAIALEAWIDKQLTSGDLQVAPTFRLPDELQPDEGWRSQVLVVLRQIYVGPDGAHWGQLEVASRPDGSWEAITLCP